MAEDLTLYHTVPTLITLRKKAFKKKKIVGKEENAGNQHFLLFQQYFLSFPTQNFFFDSHLFCYRQMLSIWIGLKFCCLVIG